MNNNNPCSSCLCIQCKNPCASFKANCFSCEENGARIPVLKCTHIDSEENVRLVDANKLIKKIEEEVELGFTRGKIIHIIENFPTVER